MEHLRRWKAHKPYLPEIILSIPEELDLSLAESEFLMMPDVVSVSESCDAYRISIKHFKASPNRPAPPSVFPQLIKQSIFGNRILMDSASLGFQGAKGSRLLIDQRIKGGRSYFLNCIRPMVAHAASQNGTAALHSALLRINNRGYLLPGVSGSGKSTLAVIAMQSGQKSITDDVALVSSEGEIAGRALRSHFFLREGTSKLLSKDMILKDHIRSYTGEKKQVLKRSDHDGLLDIESPIDCIVFPSLKMLNNNQPFKIEEVSGTKALLNLLGNCEALLMLDSTPEEKHKIMQGLVRVVQQLPIFSLTMSPLFLNESTSHFQGAFDVIERALLTGSL